MKPRILIAASIVLAAVALASCSSSSATLETVAPETAAQVIADNPDKVAEIKAGNEKLVNWLTGQVMKASKGKANPKAVTDSLKAKLG